MTQPSQSTGTAPAPAPPDAHDARRHRLRKEGTLAGSCLGIGLIVLPGLIYAFGSKVLGAYGGGPHIGSFYGDFLRNLASGTFRSWLIVLMPYAMVLALRLIFRPQLPPTPSDPAIARTEELPPETQAQSSAASQRREPFVSS